MFAAADIRRQTAEREAAKAAEEQSKVQVYRFPNAICSDRGRWINNSVPGWETTLDGRSKFVYEYWHDHLRPLGFHLKAEMLEFPGGMPSDIGFRSDLVLRDDQINPSGEFHD